MPITEEIQRIILAEGTAMDIAEPGAARGRARPAAVRPDQGQRGHDHPRRSDLGHERITTRSGQATHGHSSASGARRRSRTSSSSGKARTDGKVVRGEMRAGGESHGQRHPAPPGHPRHQGQEAPHAAAARRSSRRTSRIFTRQLATMMKAGVPLLQSFDIVGARQHEPARDQAAQRHPHRRRDRHQPVGRVPQVSAVLRRAVLQPGRGRRGRPVFWKRCSTAWRSTRKRRSAIKSKIKSALIYPIAVIVGRLRRARGDHDLRDPGVQGRVQDLRRRPAGADAVRDRDVGVLRQVLVADLRRADRRRLYFFMQSWKRSREDAEVDGPPAAQGAGLRRPGLQVGHRALDAHAVHHVRRRRAAGRGARLGRRRLGQRGLPEATEQDPDAKSRPAPASRRAMQNTDVFPTWCCRCARSAKNPARWTRCSARPPSSTRTKSTRRSKGLSSLMEPFIIVILGVLIGGIVVVDVPADLQARPGRLIAMDGSARRPSAAVASRARAAGPARRQLPERRHPPPAADAGAQWLEARERRASRRAARRGGRGRR